MLNRVIIIANGEIEDLRFYRSVITEEDFVICADGGSYLAYLLGVKPDMIIGDTDSIDKELVEKFQKSNSDIIIAKFPKNKDKSDLELALERAVILKPNEIIILAGLGKRIDHELTNILLMLGQKEYAHKIKFLGQNTELFALKKETVIKNKKGMLLTLIPLTAVIKNVNTDGLKYEIKNKNLMWGNSLTLSNIIMKKEAKIEYDGGILIGVITQDEN